MTTPGPARLPVPAWGLALTAMFSVQLGSASSVGLIATIGPAGAAWLRLTIGALMFAVIARPPLREVRRADVPLVLALGVATGLITVLFLAAIERIPLGTAVAVEFLGPLTVAAVSSHSRRALTLPSLAAVGVVLLTRPWHGPVQVTGLTYAALAAAGWATYIVLTRRVGDRFSGIGGLSLTIPIAAATAAVVGIPQAAGHLDLHTLEAATLAALLLPVLPFALEMLALRRMAPAAFGTLMALEPAFGVLVGLLVLHQHPAATQYAGVALVVLAGAAAQAGSGAGRTDQQHREGDLDRRSEHVAGDAAEAARAAPGQHDHDQGRDGDRVGAADR